MLRNVSVFDGEQVVDADSVRVAKGRIAEVGRDLPAAGRLPEYDGAGGTILPGLIDAHVHAHPGALADALRFGTTTVLDMFSNPDWIRRWRAVRESTGRTRRADVWSAGILVTAPGGHGTQFGVKIPTLAPGGDAAGFVADRLTEGSDFIKLVLEDGGPYRQSLPTLTAGQVRAVVAATHAADVLAVAHVSTAAATSTAVSSGVDVLAHVPSDQRLTASEVDAVRAAGTPVVATLSVQSTIGCGPYAGELRDHPSVAPFLTDEQRRSLGRDYGWCRPVPLDHASDNVRLLHRAGVPILAGTDAGNPGTTFGASLLGELGLLVEAGLSPREALAAATARIVDVFGLSDRGRIAPGLRADLLLVPGDPVADVNAVRDIAAIWKNGRPVNRRPAKASIMDATGPGSGVASGPGRPGGPRRR